jgi:hypothetical protein
MDRDGSTVARTKVPLSSRRQGNMRGNAHRSSSTGSVAGGGAMGMDCCEHVGPEHGARNGEDPGAADGSM